MAGVSKVQSMPPVPQICWYLQNWNRSSLELFVLKRKKYTFPVLDRFVTFYYTYINNTGWTSVKFALLIHQAVMMKKQSTENSSNCETPNKKWIDANVENVEKEHQKMEKLSQNIYWQFYMALGSRYITGTGSFGWYVTLRKNLST